MVGTPLGDPSQQQHQLEQQQARQQQQQLRADGASVVDIPETEKVLIQVQLESDRTLPHLERARFLVPEVLELNFERLIPDGYSCSRTDSYRLYFNIDPGRIVIARSMFAPQDPIEPAWYQVFSGTPEEVLPFLVSQLTRGG